MRKFAKGGYEKQPDQTRKWRELPDKEREESQQEYEENNNEWLGEDA
ncbi:hypothetical protein P4I92_19140 [Bacillus cereus]|uniref:Uncharacterized protein n=1 Tax=Bacillus thuringiensis TaxID=1428 RepID=A0AAW9JCP8_BACTU|nr:hypothetical protein [Bacillus thuringiensis]MDZ5479167.1 hypothetical protein [Bacillus thuringiensis]